MIMSIKFNPAFKVLSKYQVRAAVKAGVAASVVFWWVGPASPLGGAEGIR